ncbi:MAG: HAMP domain-containing sensor histidine kinase [Myxococcota bacterium]
MSLRLRLGLLLFAVSFGGLLAAWLVSSQTILGPFFEHVRRIHVREAVRVARDVERGLSLKELQRLHDIRLERRPKAPPRERCRSFGRRGTPVLICRGAQSLEVLVETRLGWIALRDEGGGDRVRQRLFGLLALLALALAAISWWLAGRVTRPLRVTVGAMDRMASGEMSHRLPGDRNPELRQAAGAFNRMADRVDRMLKAERSLMTGISHELRTPLARLRLEIELLRDSNEPSNARLDAMEADVEAVERLLSELFSVARASWEERPREALDLGELAREAARASQVMAEVEGRCSLVAHRPQMERLFRNLLDNSRKYGGPDVKVRVRLDESGFVFEDDGPGVDEREKERIFEAFHRAQPGAAEGWGLGLMVVRQIVEFQGGRVEARSARGPFAEGRGPGLAIEVRFS